MAGSEEGGAYRGLEELTGRGRPCEEGGLWQNLRLDWVRNWDQSCKTTILLSRLQHTGKTLHHAHVGRTQTALAHEVRFLSLLELGSCDPAVLWRYLTALHDQHRVVSWIQNRETTDARWPELTPDVVNGSTVCSTYMRENILDLLARYPPKSGPMWSLLLTGCSHVSLLFLQESRVHPRGAR